MDVMIKKIVLFVSIIYSYNVYGQDDGFIKNYNASNILCYADSIPIVCPFGIDLENNVVSFKSDIRGVIVEGKKYDGKFYFTLKQKPDLISLKEVCKRYIKERIHAPVYLINGKFLKGNVSSIKVDNNFILRVNYINSEEFDEFNKKKSPQFTFVLIFTKTEENLKRASEIRIR